MGIDFKKNAQLHEHNLRYTRAVFEVEILANATPASKKHIVDIPGSVYLRSQGKTSEADAVENLSAQVSAPVDSSGKFAILFDDQCKEFYKASVSSNAGSPPAGTPALGTARSYAALAASTITNTGNSVLTGNLGLFPGSSVTGFPPGTVSGTQDITNAAAAAAQVSALAAYTDLQARSATTIPSALDGQSLAPGVYKFASGAATLATSGAGTLTLNAGGDPNAVWVIQTASTLTTGAGGAATISIINGGSAANVYFAVGSSATINVSAGSTFQGNIIANTSITVGLGDVKGSLIALNAAITFSTATTVEVQPGSSGPLSFVKSISSGGRLVLDVSSGVNLATTDLIALIELDYLSKNPT